MDDRGPGDQLAINERAVDRSEVFDGQVIVPESEPAMTPAYRLRRNAKLTAAAPADDGLLATELKSLGLVPVFFQDQFDFCLQRLAPEIGSRLPILRITG